MGCAKGLVETEAEEELTEEWRMQRKCKFAANEEKEDSKLNQNNLNKSKEKERKIGLRWKMKKEKKERIKKSRKDGIKIK